MPNDKSITERTTGRAGIIQARKDGDDMDKLVSCDPVTPSRQRLAARFDIVGFCQTRERLEWRRKQPAWP